MPPSKPKKSKEKTGKSTARSRSTKSGMSISSGRDTNINGDVIGGDKTVTGPDPQAYRTSSERPVVQSAWANGLFYLFAFVVVASLIGWLAGTLESTQLVLVILGSMLAVPLIGAFQLRMDNRLSQKTFLELIKMTVEQLPIIRGFTKDKM